MCRLACDQNSSWLMVDDWEASQPDYQRTAVVLEHFDREINTVLGGVEDEDGAFLSLFFESERLQVAGRLTQTVDCFNMRMYIISGHLACLGAAFCDQVLNIVSASSYLPDRTLFRQCLNPECGHTRMCVISH